MRKVIIFAVRLKKRVNRSSKVGRGFLQKGFEKIQINFVEDRIALNFATRSKNRGKFFGISYLNGVGFEKKVDFKEEKIGL